MPTTRSLPRWKDKTRIHTGDFQTSLQLESPAGEYRAEWIAPVSGNGLLAENKSHTGGALLVSPRYTQDVALRLTRTTAVTPSSHDAGRHGVPSVERPMTTLLEPVFYQDVFAHA